MNVWKGSTLSEAKSDSQPYLHPEIALGAIFEAHRCSLRRLIASRMDRRLKGRIDPSDIVQETLAEAYLRINEYLAKGKYSLSKWLVALASQQVIVAHRRHIGAQKRSVRREDGYTPHAAPADVKDLLADSTDPGQRAVNVERAQRLRAAISSLSEPLRIVVTMRFIEERSIRDISSALGISEEAVSKRAMRGLRRLSAILDDSDR